MSNQINARLKHPVHTKSVWESGNYLTAAKTPLIGEILLESQTDGSYKMKIGDGANIYKNLPYFPGIDLSNYYTITEVNNLISPGMTFMGTTSSVPTTGSGTPGVANSNDLNNGDMWKVADRFTISANKSATGSDESVKPGDTIIYGRNDKFYVIPSADDIEDTWRQIDVDGSLKLGNGVSSNALNFVSGNKISLGWTDNNATHSSSLTINHDAIAAPTPTTSTSRTYVNGLTFDGYGHITGYTTGTETVIDPESPVYPNNYTGLVVGTTNIGPETAGDTLTISQGNGISLTVPSGQKNKFTIGHADTSSQASITSAANKVITGVTLDDYGHVTGLNSQTVIYGDLNQNAFSTLSDGTDTVDATETTDTLTIIGEEGIIAKLNDAEKSIHISHADVASTTETTTSSTSAVVGIEVNDKGHVTKVTTAPIVTTDTNTVYRLKQDNGTNYSTNAASANAAAGSGKLILQSSSDGTTYTDMTGVNISTDAIVNGVMEFVLFDNF